MSRVDEITAKMKELEAQLATVMQEEREAALADVRGKIKTFGIKLTELRGLFKTRKKRADAGKTRAKTAAKK